MKITYENEYNHDATQSLIDIDNNRLSIDDIMTHIENVMNFNNDAFTITLYDIEIVCYANVYNMYECFEIQIFVNNDAKSFDVNFDDLSMIVDKIIDMQTLTKHEKMFMQNNFKKIVIDKIDNHVNYIKTKNDLTIAIYHDETNNDTYNMQIYYDIVNLSSVLLNEHYELSINDAIAIANLLQQ